MVLDGARTSSLIFPPRMPKIILLPLVSVSAATALTWVLWPYIHPSASPLFFVAVMSSSLYGGLAAGLLATAASGASISFFFMVPRFSFDIGADDGFRLIAFSAVALLTNSIAAERNRAQEEQRKLIDDLREANRRVKTLSDLLPICSHCKRVQSGDTTWLSLERYLQAPDLRLTQALCPDCATREYPEFYAPPPAAPRRGGSPTS